MDRREILNELQQIVALTDFLSERQQTVVPSVPEAAQRAKGLIREVESWPTAFPPAPFVSDPCAARKHDRCANAACKCACHCPPEAPQQPAHTMLNLIECSCGYRNIPAAIRQHVEAANAYKSAQAPPEAPQQPAEPAPATERHIDTPDELLELLAGISSDPQVEGLSLSQKASTMAMLYVAKALQQIAGDVKCLNQNTCEGFDTVCIAIEPLGKALQQIAGDECGSVSLSIHRAKPSTTPQEPT